MRRYNALVETLRRQAMTMTPALSENLGAVEAADEHRMPLLRLLEACRGGD